VLSWRLSSTMDGRFAPRHIGSCPSTGEPVAKPDRKPPFPMIRIERRRLRQHRQKHPRQ
jgi:hypothetical protein